MNTNVLFLLLVIILGSCSSNRPDLANADLSMTYLKANMEFLASDELQGREVTSFGGYAAAQFITNQLKKYGVEPYSEEGYFQNFTVYSMGYSGSKVAFESEDEVDSLKYLEDFYVYTIGDTVTRTALVFAGYGIVDTSNNINDYENIDVAGKTVLVLRGIPSGYKGSNKTSWTRTKSRTAQQAGAVGCIVIYTDQLMKSWSQLIENEKKESISRKSTRKDINTIILDSLSIKKMFNMPSKTFAVIRNELEQGLIEKGTVLKETVTWQLNEVTKDHTARNIIGILRGTDSNLQKEYVTIGAHYDHVGIKNGEVNNGADDNASGTVATLECARLLTLTKNNKRPVLFCFWDGEEKGLLGSDYFATSHNDINEIVVNINLDMVGREHEDSLAVIGSGKLSSEFFHIVDDVNKKTSNFVFDYTFDDKNHPERFYYRSDHWSFAKLGVPVVFLFDNENKDYHTPRDDADKINYLKLKKVVNLAEGIALEVANLDHKLKVDHTNISGLDAK